MKEYIKKGIPFVFKHKNKYFTTVESLPDCGNCCFRKECEKLVACSFVFTENKRVIGKEVPEYQILFGGEESENYRS